LVRGATALHAPLLLFPVAVSPRLAKLKARNVEPKPGQDYPYGDVQDWLISDDAEVRHALVTYMRAKANDPEFRAALIQNMAHHPEWNAVPGRWGRGGREWRSRRAQPRCQLTRDKGDAMRRSNEKTDKRRHG